MSVFFVEHKASVRAEVSGVFVSLFPWDCGSQIHSMIESLHASLTEENEKLQLTLRKINATFVSAVIVAQKKSEAGIFIFETELTSKFCPDFMHQ